MKNRTRALILICFSLLCAGLVYIFVISSFNPLPRVIDHTINTRSEKFPEVETESLSVQQRNILKFAKQEFDQQPDPTKYSNGMKEAWCADFVSWIYKEAGLQFNNPNSGSWRIPGTITLRDYYESLGRFRAKEEYSPKVGDLMFYDNPSAFGQHVNIVVKTNDEGSVTTVGGNEPGGIRVLTHERHNELGFLGYGVLD